VTWLVQFTLVQFGHVNGTKVTPYFVNSVITSAQRRENVFVVSRPDLFAAALFRKLWIKIHESLGGDRLWGKEQSS